MSKYLWCEDSKSGYQFLCAIFHELFPDIVVESKGSNTGLRKAARKIDSDGNHYYILMDAAMDNPDVVRETMQLKKETAGKENIHIIPLHSFEFALLSFELLEQWVFAETDDLKDQRQEQLKARAVFVKAITSEMTVDDLAAFRDAFEGYKSKNSEQIAARLLFEITRNTGFETDKSKIGKCFINNCCEWESRQEDDICGLDDRRISAGEKARILVARSVLGRAFEGM